MAEFRDGMFAAFSWVGLFQIIGLNIILSGDNALVIAMAVRSLPKTRRTLGIWLGTGAAVVLRIVFAAIIVYLLKIPLLTLIGSVLLLWIAIKLQVPEEEGAQVDDAGGSLWKAVRIIVVADAVMSFDNVISVAAAAQGHIGLLSLGIAISIPLVVVGAQLMLWLLDRIPALMVAGSALLGWVAGELALSDPIVEDALGHPGDLVTYGVCAAAAVFVVVVGLALTRRHSPAEN